MDSKYIFETYKSKLFFNYFYKVKNFGSQNISKSIFELKYTSYLVYRGTFEV